MSEDKKFVDRMEAYNSAFQKMDESEKHFEEHIESYLVSDDRCRILQRRQPWNGS